MRIHNISSYGLYAFTFSHLADAYVQWVLYKSGKTKEEEIESEVPLECHNPVSQLSIDILCLYY